MSEIHFLSLLVNRSNLVDSFTDYLSTSSLIFKHYLRTRKQFFDHLNNIQQFSDYSLEAIRDPTDDTELDVAKFEVFPRNDFVENSQNCCKIMVEIREWGGFKAIEFGDVVGIDIYFSENTLFDNKNVEVKSLITYLLQRLKPVFGFSNSDSSSFAYNSYFKAWEVFHRIYIYDSSNIFWQLFHQKVKSELSPLCVKEFGQFIWLENEFLLCNRLLRKIIDSNFKRDS
jgi:hypothetical protein